MAELEVRDDVAVWLDQTFKPLLDMLRSGTPAVKLDAVTLSGSVCEKRKAAAGYLVAEGALPHVASLLVKGEITLHA